MYDPRALIDEMRERFFEEGWVRLGPLLSSEELADLRARADALMLGRIRHEGLFFQKDAPSGRYEDLEYGKGWQGPSLQYRKLEKLEKDPLFARVIHHERLEPIVRGLIDGPVSIYRAMLFNKPAAAGTPLPWHQDAGSMWGLDRDPMVQIWIAIDDAPLESGPLEIMSRTHALGLATPLGGRVPPEVVTARGDPARVVRLPAAAGEAILLHNLVWHRSGTNGTAHARRAMSIAYIPANTRCLRKKRAPRTFYAVWP